MPSSILLDTGLWAVAAGVSFALILLSGILGPLLGPRLGLGRNQSARKAALLWMAFLCMVLALSLVPVMVGSVLGFQEGNRGVPVIGLALDNQAGIVMAIWLLMLSGSALAVPAMMRDMRFDG